jgi:hypothetical protein
MPLQTRTSGGTKVGGYPRDLPRRVTRALARKLQEGSVLSGEMREISPVLAATSPELKRKDVDMSEISSPELKREDVDMSEISSLSLPCLTASLQPTVKEEQSVRGSEFPPQRNDSDKVSPPTPPRLGLVVCSACGNSDVRMTTRECSNTFRCERCLLAITDLDEAKHVSRLARTSRCAMWLAYQIHLSLAQLMHQQNQRARDDAILLPPPAKQKVLNQILESLRRTDSNPAAERERSSDFLPPLELGKPRIHFSNDEQRLPSVYSSVPDMSKQRHALVHSLERRTLPPRTFLPSSRATPRFYPLRPNESPAPYQVPFNRHLVPRRYATSPVHRWPSPIPSLMRRSPYDRVVDLRDIKRRRTVLLDFREVALDLLEETSTVLNQLDNTLHKMALRRKQVG